MCFLCAPSHGLSLDYYDSHESGGRFSADAPGTGDPGSRPAASSSAVASGGGYNEASRAGITELIAQTFDAADDRYEFTGDQRVDAVLWGSRWTLTNLTFSFPTSGAFYADQGYAADGEPNGQIVFNAAQQAGARYALNLISDYCNLTFTEITETATTHAVIRLSQSSNNDQVGGPGGSAEGNFPSSKAMGGDIWFASNPPQVTYQTPGLGNFGLATMMHEIGHTMGLKHGHQNYKTLDLAQTGDIDRPAGGGPRFGSNELPDEVDGQDWSLMTYRSDPAAASGPNEPGPFQGDGFNQPQTYMQFDIAALQHLYGANFRSNATNSVYTWSTTTGEQFINGVGQGQPTSNKISSTVWDGNGVDTYDLSNYTTNLSINLAPGAFSTFSTSQLVDHRPNDGDTALAVGNVANALLYHGDVRSLIENAKGGGGNDRIVGNQADNALNGGAGNDRMEGGLGSDTLFGGGARIGQTGGGPGLVFGSGQISFASNPGNTSLAAAVDISKQFSLAEDPIIFESGKVPHVTVNSVGGGQGDFFKISITGSFTLLTIDFDSIGLSNAFDTIVYVYDANGNPVALNDDSTMVDPGSTPRTRDDGTTDTTDSLLQTTVPNPGVYYIGVYKFDPATQNTVFVGAGERFRLHVSAFNEPVADEIRTGDILSGGDGFDTADYSAAVAGVTIDLRTAKQTAAGGANGDTLTSIEKVVGSGFVDKVTASDIGCILQGAGGNDALIGGSGVDALDGGAGADQMQGGGGDDFYFVDEIGDVISEAVSAGLDTVLSLITYILGVNLEVLSLSGAAVINGTGNALVNSITGNAAANQLDGGVGADAMSGGLGNDRYIVDDAGDKVTEAAAGGIDTVLTTVSYTLGAGQEIERLYTTNDAGTAALRLTGNGITNTLKGNAGANVLDGGSGADGMYGLGGNDTYRVDAASDRVIEAEDGGIDTVLTSVNYTLEANQEIERLYTTSDAGTAAIKLTGNAIVNTLKGNAGANVLDGGAGADAMYGLGGADTYVVDATGDRVIEAAGGGADLVLTSVDYTLAAGQEIERLYTANDPGTAALKLTGNEIANTLKGNAGGNALNGGGAADNMFGLGGNDVYTVDAAGDKAIETAGGGTDTVLTSVDYTLGAGQEIERLYTTNDAGTAALKLTGNEIGNLLKGNAGANTLNGGGGADTMYGLGGNDIYHVGVAGDRVIEAAAGGNDLVLGDVSYVLGAGQEIERLYAETAAGTAAIQLTGNEFANTIRGNAGANVIDGGLKVDTLFGLGGKDTFVFSSAIANNIDHVADFVVVDDTIRLDRSVFAALGVGALAQAAFKDIGIAGAVVDDTDRVIYNRQTGALFYDADGSLNGSATLQFATLDNKALVTHADFLVVA